MAHDLPARTHKTAPPVLPASVPSLPNPPNNERIESATEVQIDKSYSTQFALLTVISILRIPMRLGSGAGMTLNAIPGQDHLRIHWMTLFLQLPERGIAREHEAVGPAAWRAFLSMKNWCAGLPVCVKAILQVSFGAVENTWCAEEKICRVPN
ncbi:MAG: hypothetical protein ABJH45_13255 [Paracoccaceae bacterium]